MTEENERVQPPLDLNEDEALKEYGRQLAMDSLMVDLEKVVKFPARDWNRRAWISGTAASLAGLAGFAIWKFGKAGNGVLDPRWMVEAARGAEYRILGPHHVMLLKGEMRFTSSKPARLLVETANAKASANGTDFFIAHYGPNQTKNDMKTKNMTRLLVLAGSVTLTTGQGAEKANANEALVAKGDEAPEKILVKANSKFAFDFYSHLAKADADANLFFSPYSMSNALLMVAEGARGETALEMGKVLGFPESLLRYEEDAQKIPWKVGRMSVGQSRLNEMIGGHENLTPEQAKLRKEETALTKQWEDLEKESKTIDRDDEEAVEKFILKVEVIAERIDEIRPQIDTMTLRIANAVWGDQTADFLEPWKKTISGTYGAEAVQEADFINDFKGERRRINTWVEKQTENRIQNLFPENSLNEDTRFVIANAIYFKGDWLEPFREKRTSKQPFALGSGGKIDVDLMKKYGDESVRYAAFNGDGSFFETPVTIPSEGKKPRTYPGKDGFAMIEKPYRGGNVSMVVIAPNDPAGLSKLEGTLEASRVASWISALRQRDTHIQLPKFKMETSYDLGGTLAEMGMPTAFDMRKANFTGISAGGDLFIASAFHKAFIEVNEKGTEAAAATGAAVGKNEILQNIPFTPTFKADRPFIYLIRDRKSGAILFLGRVLDPTK